MSDTRQVVPKEPTPEMDDAGKAALVQLGIYSTSYAGVVWRAMYDAAPVPAPPAEPVAWMMPIGDRGLIEWGAARPCYPVDANAWQPLYAAPAAEPEREQGDPRDDRSYTGQIAALKRALRDVMLESDRARRFYTGRGCSDGARSRMSILDTDAYIRARALLSAP